MNGRPPRHRGRHPVPGPSRLFSSVHTHVSVQFAPTCEAFTEVKHVLLFTWWWTNLNWTDGPINEWADEWTDEWTDGPIDGLKNRDEVKVAFARGGVV